MKGARPEARAHVSTDVLARIQEAVEARSGRKEGREWRFLCPAHDDHRPSARWNPGKGTWCCDACDAGGGALDLCHRLGLALPDREPEGLALEDLARAKGLNEGFLRELGARDGRQWGRSCVLVPYCDAEGEVRAERRRLSLTSEPRFSWRRGDKALPYGLPRLDKARGAGYIVVVEGESDAWTLMQLEIPALGIPGANTWRTEWAAYLVGIEKVYAWREPDRGGDSLAAKLSRDIPDIRVIEAPIGVKDPNALWLSLSCDPVAFRQLVADLVANARSASALRAEAFGEEARECFALARPLLEAPDLLDRVAGAIRASGYAGDVTPALLAYIALTSRLTDRPLNLAYVAESAAGKSYAVDIVLGFLPETAYHRVGASSARALIYDHGADYQHRTVIVAEADSIPEDGPAASAVRSLASDNLMAYDVVEQDRQTGQFATRYIRKPGPTGLITTSTNPLGNQLGTRMLTVSVPDTPDQTRAVLRVQAAAANDHHEGPNPAAFVALQRWLELAGDRDVIIAFAPQLAESIPAELVRVRRDFRQLLSAIRAVAILYQRQRDRDGDGSIIATLEDYRRARQVLLDVFTETVTGGVSRELRETVEAVAELYDGDPVDTERLSGKLRLHRTAVWRRAKTAVSRGFLVNEESRKGRPLKLALGARLPEHLPSLPDPESFDVCLPETRATVQPNARAPISTETDDAVANDVASCAPVAQPGDTAQPAVQPSAVSIANTETGSVSSPVAPLQPNQLALPAPILCDECGECAAYQDSVPGTWFCENHGPTWTTARRAESPRDGLAPTALARGLPVAVLRGK